MEQQTLNVDYFPLKFLVEILKPFTGFISEFASFVKFENDSISSNFVASIFCHYWSFHITIKMLQLIEIPFNFNSL